MIFSQGPFTSLLNSLPYLLIYAIWLCAAPDGAFFFSRFGLKKGSILTMLVKKSGNGYGFQKPCLKMGFEIISRLAPVKFNRTLFVDRPLFQALENGYGY